MAIKVYIAASSRDHVRAAQCAKMLEYSNVVVLVDRWWEGAEKWSGTDHKVTIEDAQWAVQGHFEAIDLSPVFWLLAPSTPSAGASAELGYALANKKHVVASGEFCAHSIYYRCAARSFVRDADAAAAIRSWRG